MATLKNQTIADTYDQLVKRQDSYSSTGNRIEIMNDSGTMVSTSLYLDAVNGRVGMGIATPATDLDIASNTPTITLTDLDATNDAFCTIAGLTGSLVFKADADSDIASETMQWWMSGSQKMTLLATGNLGIGTTNPSNALHVDSGDDPVIARFESSNNTAADYSCIRLQGVDADGDDAATFVDWFHDPTTDKYGFGEGSAASALPGGETGDGASFANADIVVDAGKVGIGTSSPTGTLTIVNTNSDTIAATNTEDKFPLMLKNVSTGTNKYTGIGFIVNTEVDADMDSIGAAIYCSRDGSASDTTKYDSKLQFATNDGGDDGNTVRMSIDHDGKVGIGWDSPSHKLVVRGDGEQIRLNSADYNIISLENVGSGGGLDEGLIRMYDAGSTKVQLSANGDSYFSGGDVGIGTASPDRSLHIMKSDASIAPQNTNSELILEENSHCYMEILTPNDKSAGLLISDGADGSWRGAFFYDHSTDTAKIGASGSVAIYVDGDASGNVGINQSTPNARLHVDDSTADDDPGTSGNANIKGFRIEGNSNVALDFGTRSTGTDLCWMQARSSADYSNNKTLALNPNGGNVGVGTADPQSALHIETADSTAWADTATYANYGLAIRNNHDGLYAFAGIAFDCTTETEADSISASISCISQNTDNHDHRGTLSFATNNDDESGNSDAALQERMRITSDGKVGIGTTDPAKLFEILTNATSPAEMRLTRNAGGTSYDELGVIEFYEDNYVNEVTSKIVGARGSSDANQGQLEFWTQKGSGNLAQNMTLNEDGNLGIGTTDPQATLHVTSTSAGSHLLIESTEDGTSSAPDIEIRRKRVDSGTTQVGEDGDYLGIVQFTGYNDNGTPQSVGYADIYALISDASDGTEDGYISMRTIVNGSLHNSLNIRAGKVGINKTVPATQFHVLGDEASAYVSRFVHDGDNANRYGLEVRCGADDGSGTTYYFNAADGDGNNTGYLKTVSGTFSLADTSDIRLKKDVVDTSINGLNSINAMKVRDFKWKRSGESVTAGFIANELKEVCPHVVAGEPDAMESYDAEYDNDGNIIEEAGERIVPMTVSRDLLVPVLVKAIQELTAKVEALENK